MNAKFGELNVPKNITEYWSTVTLKAFIRDATAFRLKSSGIAPARRRSSIRV